MATVPLSMRRAVPFVLIFMRPPMFFMSRPMPFMLPFFMSFMSRSMPLMLFFFTGYMSRTVLFILSFLMCSMSGFISLILHVAGLFMGLTRAFLLLIHFISMEIRTLYSLLSLHTLLSPLDFNLKYRLFFCGVDPQDNIWRAVPHYRGKQSCKSYHGNDPFQWRTFHKVHCQSNDCKYPQRRSHKEVKTPYIFFQN